MFAVRLRSIRCVNSPVRARITEYRPTPLSIFFSTAVPLRRADINQGGYVGNLEDVDDTIGGHPDPNYKGPMTRLPLSVQANYYEPLRRKPTHGLPVCNLQIRSYSVRNLEFMCDIALRAAYYAGLPASGPVPLPKKTGRWTVPRGNFVHKKSQENYERVTHKRLIQIKDGHPETVELWLASIKQHQFYGVGMKANVFGWDKIGIGKEMRDVKLETLRDVPRPKWAHFGPRKEVDTAEKVREILNSPKYKDLEDKPVPDAHASETVQTTPPQQVQEVAEETKAASALGPKDEVLHSETEQPIAESAVPEKVAANQSILEKPIDATPAVEVVEQARGMIENDPGLTSKGETLPRHAFVMEQAEKLVLSLDGTVREIEGLVGGLLRTAEHATVKERAETLVLGIDGTVKEIEGLVEGLLKAVEPQLEEDSAEQATSAPRGTTADVVAEVTGKATAPVLTERAASIPPKDVTQEVQEVVERLATEPVKRHPEELEAEPLEEARHQVEEVVSEVAPEQDDEAVKDASSELVVEDVGEESEPDQLPPTIEGSAEKNE